MYTDGAAIQGAVGVVTPVGPFPNCAQASRDIQTVHHGDAKPGAKTLTLKSIEVALDVTVA